MPKHSLILHGLQMERAPWSRAWDYRLGWYEIEDTTVIVAYHNPQVVVHKDPSDSPTHYNSATDFTSGELLTVRQSFHWCCIVYVMIHVCSDLVRLIGVVGVWLI